MTDRREGTPDPEDLTTGDDVPARDEANKVANDAEAEAGRAIDDAVDDASDDGTEVDDDEIVDDLASDAEADELEVDDYEAAVSEVAAANAGTDAPVPAIPAPTSAKRRAPETTASRAPTASEIAVHVREDVSKVFVIVAVGVFVVILLNGLLLGSGGLLSPKPTPSLSPSPSASASAAPSASASASAGASPSASPAASASPSSSAVPSASASAAGPSASPSAPPSP